MKTATLHFWRPLIFIVTKRTLLLLKISPHKNVTQHKWHLTKKTSHKKSLVPSGNHTINLRIPFSKSLSLTLGKWSLGIFSQGVPFCKVPFFVGVIFFYFTRSICHVPIFPKYHYFQIALRGAFSAGCHFCWMYLMVLFLFF